MKIFISFSHDDIELVRHIEGILRKAQVEVFVDYIYVRGGDSFRQYMNDKIDECTHFLLIWSESARQSKWVRIEMERMDIRIKQAADKSLKIIPCRATRLDLPAEIETTAAIEFGKFKHGMKALFEVLGLDVNGLPSDIPNLSQGARLIPDDLVSSLKDGNPIVFVGKEFPEGMHSNLIDCFSQLKRCIFLSESDGDFRLKNSSPVILIDHKEKRNQVEKINIVGGRIPILILGFSGQRASTLQSILDSGYLVNSKIIPYPGFFNVHDEASYIRHKNLGGIIRGNQLSGDSEHKNCNIFINYLNKHLKAPESVFVLSEFENWIEERAVVKAFLEQGINTKHLRDCPAGETIQDWAIEEIGQSDILLYLSSEFPVVDENHLSIKGLIKHGIECGCKIIEYSQFEVERSLPKYFLEEIEDSDLFEATFLSEIFESPLDVGLAVSEFSRKYNLRSHESVQPLANTIDGHLEQALKANYNIPFDATTDRIFISKEAMAAVERANLQAKKLIENNIPNLTEKDFRAKLEYAKLLRFRGDWNQALLLLQSIFESGAIRHKLLGLSYELDAQLLIEYGALKFESGLVKDKEIEGISSIKEGLQTLKSGNLDIEFVKVLKQLGNLYREQGNLDKARNLINSSKYLIQVLLDNNLNGDNEQNEIAHKVIYFDAMREYANLMIFQGEWKEAEASLNFLLDEMSVYILTEKTLDMVRTATAKMEVETFIGKNIQGMLKELDTIRDKEFFGKETFLDRLDGIFKLDFSERSAIIKSILEKAKVKSASKSKNLQAIEHFSGIVKYSIGQLLVKTNQHWKGLKVLFDSLNTLQKYDNPVRISFVLHWIGKAMLGLSWKNSLDEAKSFLLKAQRLRMKCNHRHFLAYSELELGNFYVIRAVKRSNSPQEIDANTKIKDLEDFKKAKIHYQFALSVFEELGKIEAWGNVLLQLGRYEALKDNIQEAKDYLNQARLKFRALDPPNEAKIREVNFEIINISKIEKEATGKGLKNISLNNYIDQLKQLKGENEVKEPLYLNEIGEYRFHSWLKDLVNEKNKELASKKDADFSEMERGDDADIFDIEIGDDAAVLNIPGEVVLTTDAAPGSICRSHEVRDGNYAGHFSVIHSISDLLAMGATPVAVLLNMYLDRNATIEYAKEVIEVVIEKAGEYGARLVGGDIKERKTQSIGCVGIGSIKKGNAIKRSCAAPGQIVAISLARNRSQKELDKGNKVRKIGQRWAADVLEHLKDRFDPDSDHRLLEILKEYREEPHIKQDLLFLPDQEMIAGADTGKIRSAIDTSDGFMSCLEILGRESVVDFVLEEELIEKVIADEVIEIADQLKRHHAQFLFNAGHDWEIVMTIEENHFVEVRDAFRLKGGDLAPLGRVVEKNPGFQKEIGVFTIGGEIKKVPIFTDEKFVRESYEKRVSEWDDLDINFYLNHPHSIEDIDYERVPLYSSPKPHPL